MIPPAEIETFFTKVLDFPDWMHQLHKNKLEFLKQLVRRYNYNTYFHNIHMASISPEIRRTPTLEEVIKIGLEGNGGVCLHHNAFITFLLSTIGFQTFMATGNCIGSTEPDIHCMCIVKLSDKETYLLDLACGLPIEEPIPLHALPYSGKAAGFRYEYRYSESKNEYQRWQMDGAFFKGNYEDPSYEQMRYSFNLEPKEFPFFQKSLHNIFTLPAQSIFLRHPFLFRYLDLDGNESKEMQTGGRRFILIWGASMVICDDNSREVTYFDSYDEIKPKILKYFPKVDPVKMEISFGYFNKESEIVKGDH